MVPIKKVEDLINKHSNLEKELSSGNVDKKLFAEKSKEYSDLNEIIKEAKDYISFEKNKNDLEKIINDSSSDKEIKEIAYIELQEIIKKHKNNEKKIKLFLLPKDEADSKNAIIEIRAGTGGLEASLFASDLFKMYEKISHKKKWTLEIISISKSDAGGLKEPIAYIIGYKEFWKKKFKVNTNVLIPRPDTEHLVEEALKLIPNNSSLNILDIGTGTGCIILSILCERNKCYGVALDISKKALNIAKYNAKIQQIKNRIKFVNSDIDKFKLGTYDIILSNPPYIKKFLSLLLLNLFLL